MSSGSALWYTSTFVQLGFSRLVVNQSCATMLSGCLVSVLFLVTWYLLSCQTSCVKLNTTDFWERKVLWLASCKWAYGKAGNRNETETGNGNWKWKLETKMGTKKNTPITGAICFLHDVLGHYTLVFYLAMVTGLALWLMCFAFTLVLCFVIAAFITITHVASNVAI